MRKPFYRAARKAWFVVGPDGKFIRLHEDEEKAFDIWNAMRETGKKAGHPHLTVPTLSSRFLNEQELILKKPRYALVEHYISAFAKSHPRTLCSEVTKTVVLKWVCGQNTWGDWARHDAIACVKKLFKWGLDEAQISRNPVANLANPKPESRQRVMSDAEHALLVEAARSMSTSGREFAHVLIASRCGVRPQHIREVTAANVFGDTWVFLDHKTRAKTRKPLVVYLPPCLVTLTRMLVRVHPSGHLFCQESGAKWTKDHVVTRIRKLRAELKLSDDVVAYAYRHTFATNALLAGVSLSEVATLLGHTDTRMVSQVYGHLDQHQQHLMNAAARSYQKPQDDSGTKSR